MEKKYLYHRVPENMRGTFLYPLSTLRYMHRDLYEYELTKYATREQLLSRHIPYLDCLWNDVIFMASIDPHVVNAEFMKAGFRSMKHSYYKIDLAELDQTRLVTFLDKKVKRSGPEDFNKFDIRNFSQYSRMTQDAIDYYNEKKKQNYPFEKMMPYCFLTHIMFQGPIDVYGCEVVQL
jgi:hypothetical protein